ncbi:MAG: NAD(P)H-dependent oxidoreductase [Bacteroidetes bacterium]|jgi:chromate reductase|nr:NAD(P)H-dependent oxidoreductase [Bacteroidota bacterium]MBP7256346.1 NAD(P)H-dependent oxidoreductase [Chitinophagales bacterium]MBK7139617.1 NAD(P)H-dependent oxidoreductase [Bacteroidota bacterium]MBK7504795.1 NAD(P)H-dependent oxidoreductase [Bacteroidota bacterium]MBK7638725.1 NAD(P)H-dependent oxidoreductase [Bacteroidota bacterium]
MITLISATNRPDSNTLKIAHYYLKKLSKKGIEHAFFSLEQMPQDLLTNEMYGPNKNPKMKLIEETLLIPTTKFIFIVPEYNGSFPGAFKTFIDASNIAACFHNKKACMVGVAAGRAGNLRGMEHLTNIFNHMKINVLHLKIPISDVSNQLDENGDVHNKEIDALIDKQIELLLDF